jgi:diguanylate cyclase (GGDEF)-like protein/PAS domain S-box-containing protein
MNFSALKKLLTNNGRFKPDDPDFRRVYMLNAVLLLYIGVAIVFAVLNATKAYYYETIVHSSAAVLCALTLVGFHRTDRLNVFAYAVVVIMLGMMVSIFTNTGPVHYIFVWSCAVPPAVFFLLGRKTGLVISLAVLAYMTVYMALGLKTWAPAEFALSSVVNICGVLVTMIVLAGYFELSRNEAASSLHTKNAELEAANAALTESREKLRLILDSTAEAIFGVDMENRCTFCNASCLEMLGLKSAEELLGKDVHDLIHMKRRDGSELLRSECNIIRTCMEGVAVHTDDEVFWRPGGSCFDVEYDSYPQYRDGELVGAVVTFVDNTIKKMHEQQIEYYSSHDSLTGLLNRSYYESMMARLDIRNNLPISIIMGDLNGLKLTNDIFGHAAGDELLVKTAEVLKKVCRTEDLIARLGGDEFVILLPRTQRADAEQVIGRIKDVLGKERVDAIRCSMSLGCDTKDNSAQSLDLTGKNAENEMYKEKALNRGKVNTDMINAIIMSLYAKSAWEEQHAANVSELCKVLGEALGLPDTEVAQLRSAGFLHDIGKIGIDAGLLNKADLYTEDEELEYRQHPVIGYRILNLFDTTLNLADGVYSHHEHWNGTGFPRALKGNEIPLTARIIAVAGRYDTLRNGWHERPVTHSEALVKLQKEAGALLDPNIVDVFIHMMEVEGKP